VRGRGLGHAAAVRRAASRLLASCGAGGREHGKDTYRIRLSSGYDSGAEQIRHGDVDIRVRDRDHHHHDANADHYKAGVGQDGG
jgi:hypothetical protein